MKAMSQSSSAMSEQPLVEVGEPDSSEVFFREEEAITDTQNEDTQASELLDWLRNMALSPEPQLENILGYKTKGKSNDWIHEADHKAIALKTINVKEKKKTRMDCGKSSESQNSEWLNELPVNLVCRDVIDWLKGISKDSALVHQSKPLSIEKKKLSLHGQVACSSAPSECKHKVHAHEGGCASILFQHNSDNLITGGEDGTIKIWDTNAGTLSNTIYTYHGSVNDLAVIHNNQSVITASGSNLYVWDVVSAQILHTRTHHRDKICAVDVSKGSRPYVISAGHDKLIQTWDMEDDHGNTTTTFGDRKCNALCISNDGNIFFSGHANGRLCLWGTKTAWRIKEIASHPSSITPICLSSCGRMILTSGRDNVHKLYYIRTFHACNEFKVKGNTLSSRQSRSCLSPDDNWIAAGYAAGSIHVWSRLKGERVAILKGHTAPVLSCSLSALGMPLASADEDGAVCIWS